ncbi:unnamed protein product [Didymodactylos carnosus]|uniref:Uncharacterized protein n=1 Tax=Didymodactylos carnosus TaxID=1234261 RepID=A0A8S2D348_9BILA|nr:unnamed protein product [Didymodactylos carnosus]CAF3610591.1 unnamed protein product [Didymodactylos carnosus]
MFSYIWIVISAITIVIIVTLVGLLLTNSYKAKANRENAIDKDAFIDLEQLIDQPSIFIISNDIIDDVNLKQKQYQQRSKEALSVTETGNISNTMIQHTRDYLSTHVQYSQPQTTVSDLLTDKITIDY